MQSKAKVNITLEKKHKNRSKNYVNKPKTYKEILQK